MMTDSTFVAMAKIAASKKSLYVKGAFGAPAGYRNNKERYTNNYDYNKKRADLIKAASDDTFFFDCVGLVKGILWGWHGAEDKQYGGASYSSNDVPDLSEAGILAKCRDVSTDFSNIRPGEFLWMTGHCGIYIGDGLAIESSPKWSDGVQITAVVNVGLKARYNGRTWTTHGMLPWVIYSSQPVIGTYDFTFNLASKGDKGADVRLIQTILKGSGYKGKNGKVLAIDGIFGDQTEHALRSFQKTEELEADGIAGHDTWSVLLLRNGG